MKHPGRFITFEGIDGCGKTTQIKRAFEYLSARKVPVVLTREPGGSRISERIREIIMAPDHAEMCDPCELLLYLASRAQHVHETITPALDKGITVLCDRFQEATFAYQGFGRGIDRSILERLNAFATGGLAPDLTLIFDISVDVAARRLSAMKKSPDRLEGNNREFFDRVRTGYASIAREHPERVVLLPGEEPVDSLAEKVAALLRKQLSIPGDKRTNNT